VNQQVSDAAEARRIFCNVVDAPGQLYYAVDHRPLAADGRRLLGGTSPVLARLLREKLESILPHLGQLARYAGHLRARVKQQFATVGERRRFLGKAVCERPAGAVAGQ
jgi:uroporphyrin-III C-methyltransferase/precorrin-2 dehydrogenase/sirohydrochlorin ferrochelatase